MSFEDQWAAVVASPTYQKLNARDQADMARFFATTVARKEVKGTDPRMVNFLRTYVTREQPAKPSGPLGSLKVADVSAPAFAREVGETLKAVASNPVATAKAFIKAEADDNFTGQALRAARRVDAAMKGPNINPLSPGFGKPNQYRPDFRHFAPIENPDRAEQVGQALGMALDPLALRLPLSFFAKPAAAPVAQAGINLLPKAAPAAGEALKAIAAGTAGAAATGGVLSAGHYVASSLNDNLPVDPKQALEQGLLGAALSAPFGAVAGVAPLRTASAARKAEQNAQARVAAQGSKRPVARNPVVDDARMQEYLTAREQLTAGAAPSQQQARKTLEQAAKGLRMAEALPSQPGHFTAEEVAASRVAREAEAASAPRAEAAPPLPRPDGVSLAAREAEALRVKQQAQVDRMLESRPDYIAPEQGATLGGAAIQPESRAAQPATDALTQAASAAARAQRGKPRIQPDKAAPALQASEQVVPAAPVPRQPDPIVPPASAQPSLMGRLLQEESGAVDLGAVGDTAKSAASGALRAAEVGGSLARRASDAYVALIDKALGATGVKGGFARLEELRQAAKHGETDVPIANLIRKAMVSDFGAPDRVLQIADQARRNARQAVMPMRRRAFDLMRDLTPQQQHDLELAVTEPTLREAMIAKIARDRKVGRGEIQALVDGIVSESTRITGLLKGVGAVNERGAARWEGQYLPRTYEDRFPVVSKLYRKSKTLAGKQARGTEKEVSPASVEKLKAEGWEFLGETGGKARMWRDWTLTERQQMRQEFHASQAMDKMAREAERDLEAGEILKEIAKDSDEKGAFAIPVQKGDGGAPTGYTLFDSRTARGTDVKRWGALADHYVRDDVAHFLTWTMENRDALQFIKSATGTNLWKRFKTIWNPGYYVNNVMMNVPTLELAGGSSAELPAAFREAIGQGELFRRLEEFGTIRDGRVAKDLATQLEFAKVGTGTPLDALTAISRQGKRFENFGANVSQASDDLFRLALVQAKMREGMAFEEAAKLAEGTFYDSSKVTAPAAQVLEAAGVPFARALWFMVDRTPELILKNPAKAVALYSYWQLARFVSDKASGVSDAEKVAREGLLPDHMKGLVPAWAPGANNLNQFANFNAMPLPVKDSKGNALVLNTHNWNPLNFLDNAEAANLPFYPQALMPSGPIPALLQALVGKDWFYDKDLVNGAKDERLGFLWNNLGPSGLTSKVATLWDAVNGREAYNGLPYDPATAVGNLAGFKAQPYSPELAVKRLTSSFKQEAGDIEGEIRRLAVLANRNPQDAPAHHARIEELARKLQALSEAFGRRVAEAEPALQGPTP